MAGTYALLWAKMFSPESIATGVFSSSWRRLKSHFRRKFRVDILANTALDIILGIFEFLII